MVDTVPGSSLHSLCPGCQDLNSLASLWASPSHHAFSTLKLADSRLKFLKTEPKYTPLPLSYECQIFHPISTKVVERTSYTYADMPAC